MEKELTLKLFRQSLRALVLLAVITTRAQAQVGDPVERADSLRNARQFVESARLLEAHLRTHPADLRAELMLAEVLYWQGDFSAAARRFSRVLKQEPGNAAARRQLSEIRAAASPWLSFRANASADNQPIDRFEAQAEAGVFLTPLWSLAARGSPAQYASNDSTLRQVELLATLKGYLAGARTSVEVSAGFAPWEAELRGIETAGSEGVGAVRLKLGILPRVKLLAAVDRALYTATVASLASPFATTTPSAGLRLEGSWLGEASVQRTMYPDDNSTTTTYAWLLAPLAIASRLTVHAGYAFSYQDAQETRFTRAGVYDPYFTPEQEMQHSVAAALVTWSERGTRLQVNGSYAFYGQRQAPHVSQGPGGPGQGGPRAVVFDTQTFHPYDIHGTATLPLGSAVALTFDAEHVRTSFYRNTRAGAHLSIRFVRKLST